MFLLNIPLTLRFTENVMCVSKDHINCFMPGFANLQYALCGGCGSIGGINGSTDTRNIRHLHAIRTYIQAHLFTCKCKTSHTEMRSNFSHLNALYVSRKRFRKNLNTVP